MKKRIWMSMLSLGACLALAACGEGEKPDSRGEYEGSETGPTEAAEPTEAPTQAAEPTEAPGPVEPEAQDYAELSVEMTNNRVESRETFDSDGNTWPSAYVCFPWVSLDREDAQSFPELDESLTEYSSYWMDRAMRGFELGLDLAYDYPETMYYSNYVDIGVEVYRADSSFFGLLYTITQNYNGPHDSVFYECYAFDSKTGEALPLCDVINGDSQYKDLPQLILDGLYPIAFEGELTEEEKEDIRPVLEQMVADNNAPWSLDEDGLHFFFGAGELRGHAYGPIGCDLDLAEHPELIRPEYLPVPVSIPMEERVHIGKSATETYTLQDIMAYNGSGYDMEYNITEQDLIGRWVLVEAECEGDRSTPEENGTEQYITFDGNGFATVVRRDQTGENTHFEMALVDSAEIGSDYLCFKGINEAGMDVLAEVIEQEGSGLVIANTWWYSDGTPGGNTEWYQVTE